MVVGDLDDLVLEAVKDLMPSPHNEGILMSKSPSMQ